MQLELTPEQKSLVLAPIGDPPRVFLEGPAGCGKTTAAIERLLYLLEVGVRGDSILVWVPQRSLGQPYVHALRGATVPPGAGVDVLSIDGMARRIIELFWPEIAAPAGFDSTREPVFLTLETAQYYMHEVLEPFVQEGAFGDVSVSRNRLSSQIIDNLNKAALVGFSYSQIGERLIAAWSGPSSRGRVYEAVERAAGAFREYCIGHNLLDFSLQLETFIDHVWSREDCRHRLVNRYRHLIVDNIEEDVPVAHDLLATWLGNCATALLIRDWDGGFRTYLGADPEGADQLAGLCDRRVVFGATFVPSPAVQALTTGLLGQSGSRSEQAIRSVPSSETVKSSLRIIDEHFHTELLAQVVEEVLHLTRSQGVSSQEIAILAPFVDDALRFTLASQLECRGVSVRTHRPSRALREEPAVRCLLTLAQLAHPHWEMCPPVEDVALALVQVIEGLDWVRASYLADIVYRRAGQYSKLSPFAQLKPAVQERVTFSFGARYEALVRWLAQYHEAPPVFLDLFFGRLFDELLGRPGFGFHGKYDAGEAAANVIESVLKFRWALDVNDVDEVGKRYLRMVEGGVVAAQYLRGWGHEGQQALFIGPAYTFLTENRPVDYQFWLDVNSPAWARRLYQPLTHPFVLTRNWPAERKWTENDEFSVGQLMLRRVLLGLLRRCRVRIYLGMSDLNPRGREEQGPLLEYVQRLLRRVELPIEAAHG